MRFLIFLLVLVGLNSTIQAESGGKIPADPIMHSLKAIKKTIGDQSPFEKDQFTSVHTLKVRTNRPEESYNVSPLIHSTTKACYNSFDLLQINNWWENGDLQYPRYILSILYPKHHFW